MPRINRTGLMPKLGEPGPEERTICMPDFDYGAVMQARQVIPSRVQTVESNAGSLGNNGLDFNLNAASKRKKNR